MNRGFPIRVNRKDAERISHSSGFNKKPEAEVKIFKRGARHYLHPSLSILDRVDCELIYYKNEKIMVVSYDSSDESVDNTDYTRKVFNKCIMSGEVDFIVNTIREYIDDKKREQEYNSSINSDVSSETLDITTEETIT